MRIWTLHPSLLDSKGLVACWRETLLAQHVLSGTTRGYRNHPQLDRFKAHAQPLSAVCTYLHHLADEADARGYKFDRTRVALTPAHDLAPITVTTGQVAYELAFLQAKVQGRNPLWYTQTLQGLTNPPLHPLFQEVPGPIEAWEKVK